MKNLSPTGDLSGRTQLTRANLSTLDKLWIRDVSDTTDDPALGTDKYILAGDIYVPRTAYSVASANPFATDTYLAGSGIVLPDNPIVGSYYKAYFHVSKTNVGTATPLINIRIGSGVIGDTSRVLFTFGAGTAAADVAFVEILAWFRTVGSGTTAVIAGVAAAITNLTITGWSNAVKVVQANSSGFASNAIAGQTIGMSYNGGATAVHTVQMVRAEYLHSA